MVIPRAEGAPGHRRGLSLLARPPLNYERPRARRRQSGAALRPVTLEIVSVVPWPREISASSTLPP